MVKVLVSTTSFGVYDPEVLELMKQSGFDVIPNPQGRTLSSEELIQHAQGCAGIIAGTEKYDHKTLAQLTGLKAISRCGSGLDTIDLPAAEKLGIQVLSTPFGPTQAVAELTLGMILSLLRHIESSTAKLKQGQWDKKMGFLLEEMRFGILGLGRIGKTLGAILRRFNATVVGFDMVPDKDWAAQHNVALRDCDTVIQECDVLCLHLPYEKSLHHVIGKKELAMMKSGSYLINTSRGGLVDETALYEALRSNHLRGAAIDTFEQEPYKGPLRELENVILTPHIGSYARAGRIHMERESVENLIKALQLDPSLK